MAHLILVFCCNQLKVPCHSLYKYIVMLIGHLMRMIVIHFWCVCLYLGPILVSWGPKKQTLVAKSSVEAEYCSLALAASEVLWTQSLLHELQVPIHVPVIYCDNQSTVALSHNPGPHSHTKHMELDIFFVREKVLNKSLIVSDVPAEAQIADILTKSLAKPAFRSLRDKLRVTSFSELSSLNLRGSNSEYSS